MPTLRLFASARVAAGTGTVELPGHTVDDVLVAAVDRFGSEFADVLASCRIWVNGDETSPDAVVADDDEVAVLPPVSGG